MDKYSQINSQGFYNSLDIIYCFLAHLVYEPKSLYNHALSVIVGVTVGVGVSISVIVCVQSSQPHG